MNESVTFHIGMPRTGTTALQKRYFPKHPGVNYMGRPFVDSGLAEVLNKVCVEDSLGFDIEDAHQKLIGAKDFIQVAGKPSLVSYEDFTTYQRTVGSRRSGLGSRLVDRAEIARRLNVLFPGAKIVLVIRNQFNEVRSYYEWFLQRNRFYMNFGNWFEMNIKQPGILAAFEYWKLILCYQSTFGSDNVLVLLYEDLREHPNEFFDRMCRFIGMPTGDSHRGFLEASENASMGASELHALKLRQYVPAVMRPLLKAPLTNLLSKFEPNLKLETLRKIRYYERYFIELYSMGNRNIEQHLGLALSSHGYPL